MYTQSMPALVKALTGVLPPAALKQLTQALGNCNQPLTHRGTVNIAPEQYLYNNGIAPGGTWNPNEYNDILPTSSEAAGSDIVLPGFGGAPWNSFNYGGDSFFFKTDAAFNTNAYYGGPTFNVGGNVQFDNTQTTTLNANELITQNIITENINDAPAPASPGVPGFAGVAILPPPAIPVLDVAVPQVHVIKEPSEEEIKYLSTDQLAKNVPNPDVMVPDKAISGGVVSLCIPSDSIKGATVSVDIPQSAISGVTLSSGTVGVTLSGGEVVVNTPSNAISGGTVAISGIPTNAISEGVATISGIPANAISGGTVSVAGVPTNAISGGTVSITGVPTNAISGGTFPLNVFSDPFKQPAYGGSIKIENFPIDPISGGTVAVALTATVTQVFNATGATLDPDTCAVTLLGSTVSVVSAVSVASASFYAVTATQLTLTKYLAGLPAPITTVSRSINGIAASTGPVTASVNVVAAATTTLTPSISGTPAAATTQAVTITGTSAAVTTAVGTIVGVTASTSQATYSVTGLAATASLAGITASTIPCSYTPQGCTVSVVPATCKTQDYAITGTLAQMVTQVIDLQVLQQAEAKIDVLTPVAQRRVRVYGP
jgi:hypothetical protein